MDDLAEDLGMSKKTLYLHFPGKEAILNAIIEGISTVTRARLEAVVSDDSLNCPEKLCRVIDLIGSTVGKITPSMFVSIKKYSPALLAKIDEVRSRTIPIIFGRLIQSGIAEGSIRSDIDPIFACEFWLQAIRGLLHPDTLERTQLTLRQTLEKSVMLYFQGLLTPAGFDQFKSHRQICPKFPLHQDEAAPAVS